MTSLTQSIDLGPTMLTISQLAARHGVSKQAISRRVNRLSDLHPDFAVRRDGDGRIVGVPVAQYEELIGTYGDSAKRPPDDRPVPRAPESVGEDASLDHARLLTAQVSAERAAIALAREKRELVRADRLEEALEEAGAAIGGVLERLPRRAEDLAAALSQDGTHGLRVALKQLARELRAQIADELGRLHDAAPADEGDGAEGRACGRRLALVRPVDD